jgi:hypothetical protein
MDLCEIPLEVELNLGMLQLGGVRVKFVIGNDAIVWNLYKI